jgi:hypothetical protein
MFNKIKYIIQIAAVMLLFAFNTPQGTTTVCLKKIPSKATQVWIDKLQNQYTLTTTEFTKYNTQTNTVQRFSNNNSTLPSSVDVSNPLRVVLCYNQYNTVVFLDDMLAPAVNAKNELTEQATLLCNSMLNGMWVYNQAELSLSRYDSQWNEVVRINNMNQVMNNFAPTTMQESNGMLYLYDVNYGCLQLNLFGGIEKKIPLPNCTKFKVFDDELCYKRDSIYYSYNVLNIEETKLNLPQQNCIDIALNKQKIVLLVHDTLYIYQR